MTSMKLSNDSSSLTAYLENRFQKPLLVRGYVKVLFHNFLKLEDINTSTFVYVVPVKYELLLLRVGHDGLRNVFGGGVLQV